MQVRNAMEEKLRAAFAPKRLVITDDSHRHAGHGGARPEGETHFTVEIVSATFAGQGRVTRQRAVFAALAHELETRVHALALTTLTPEEDEKLG